MKVKPKTIFKFKSIQNEKDLNRISDIIEKSHIYIPKANQINDPFEATSVKISLSTAGSSYMEEHGYQPANVIEEKEKYRILSFSSEVNISLMWAHYGNSFNGCCLVFSSDDAFSSIVPVVYTHSYFEINEGDFTDDYQIENAVYDSFRFKRRDWSYENEWRLITYNSHEYIEFDKKTFFGIIIGHNMNIEYKRKLIQKCDEQGIPYLFTYVLYGFSEIRFIPSNNDSTVFIEDWNVLENLCKDKKTKDFFHLLSNKVKKL